LESHGRHGSPAHPHGEVLGALGVEDHERGDGLPGSPNTYEPPRRAKRVGLPGLTTTPWKTISAPGEPLGPGQIRNSYGPQLAAISIPRKAVLLGD
jgi:hypothetical protein